MAISQSSTPITLVGSVSASTTLSKRQSLWITTLATSSGVRSFSQAIT